MTGPRLLLYLILYAFIPLQILNNRTLRSGGLYVLNTQYHRDHAVERGDIVVFHYRGETCIKRVYVLPGERRHSQDGQDAGMDRRRTKGRSDILSLPQILSIL